VASASSQSELFSSAEPAAELLVHPALSALEALQADDLTPKQALDALYQLKELMNE
jgi:DNA mismatch repair protein MutS